MSLLNDPAVQFSLAWWKGRHEAPNGYFPTMDQHLNWKVYPAIPEWFSAFDTPTPADTVLEIGCGYGEWLVPFSRLVGAIAGVDIHPTLVIKAHEILARERIQNAVMILGDGLTLPYADETFTLVYSISVFQHMPRAIVHGYLDESYRVLQPGGRAVFHFRAADGVGPYAEDIVENHTGDFSVGWTLEEVTQGVEAAGFHLAKADQRQSLIVRAEKA